MFKHEKQLFHPVSVERPNPQYAALLQEQLGGGNGELKAAMQYMSQSFRVKDPKIKDLFLDIAAEELGHMEMVAQTINLLNGHDVEADKVQRTTSRSPGTSVRTCSVISLRNSEQRWYMNICTDRLRIKKYGRSSIFCSTGKRPTIRCSGMPSMRCRRAAPIRTLAPLGRQRCISQCPIQVQIPLLVEMCLPRNLKNSVRL